ncbi:MAG: site-2 protease family protein, partial [Chloroflexaceae bacterium]|nr:site-2 protease family protein [Chloroflexaceae bacterium]
MGWSFPLVRVAGIDIKLHVTFFLILPLGALLWGLPYGPQGALFGMLMMILLFACVTLHELGHALAARRFGLPVKEILLLPLGGLAMLNRAPTKPMHELVIAIAGPLVNVAIAGVLILLALVTGLFNGITPENALTILSVPSLASAVFWLIQANVILTLFNLIPAFPLDGGRILRALLWMATDARRATRIAATAGQGIALAMGLWGLVSFNLLLVAVAIFIFFGA